MGTGTIEWHQSGGEFTKRFYIQPSKMGYGGIVISCYLKIMEAVKPTNIIYTIWLLIVQSQKCALRILPQCQVP